MGNLDVEFWLRMLTWQVMANYLAGRYADMLELRGIEQATVDAEFWEIVNAG